MSRKTLRFLSSTHTLRFNVHIAEGYEFWKYLLCEL